MLAAATNMAVPVDVVDEKRIPEYAGFVVSHLDEFKLVAHEQSGFFNATKLCLQNGRDYMDYSSPVTDGSDKTELDVLLIAKFGDRPSLNSEDVNAGRMSPASGTYVHLLKLLDVAWWLSREGYVKCAVAANAFFARTPQRLRKLNAMLKIGEGDARVEWVDERRRILRIRYAGAEYLADERGWINASLLCNGYEAFEGTREAQRVLHSLDHYLGESPRRQLDYEEERTISGTYVHPILAISALLCRGPEAYTRLADVIFARMCEASAAAAAEHRQLAAVGIAAGGQGRRNHVSG